MDPLQLRFALTTSTALIALGVLLALSGLADWGLTMVALMLLATTAVSWWRVRPDFDERVEPTVRPVAARVSAQ